MRFEEAKRLKAGDRVLCTYNNVEYDVCGIKIYSDEKYISVLCDDGIVRHHTMFRIITQ